MHCWCVEVDVNVGVTYFSILEQDHLVLEYNTLVLLVFVQYSCLFHVLCATILKLSACLMLFQWFTP